MKILLNIITFIFILQAHALLEKISDSDIHLIWSTWKTAHNKEYHSLHEDNKRKDIFLQNYEKIHHHNHNKAEEDVSLILNDFADLTEEEFRSKVHSHIDIIEEEEDEHKLNYKLLKLPQTFDWRTKGAVNPPKNQGSCGSCWAFAANAALETLVFKKKGKLYSFSEQNLVDCDKSSGGCGGGSFYTGWSYAKVHGLEENANYPYVAKEKTCQYDKSKAITNLTSGSLKINAKNNSEKLKATLLTQPVAVALDAATKWFQFYHNGVLKTNLCGTTLNHAVVIVGYTVLNGEEAFIVRNSWGPSWGDHGYIYISTNSSYSNGKGTCGILAAPGIPI